MATEKEIAAAKALLEQEGFSVREFEDNEWKRFGAVVTCNMISPGMTEKQFVGLIEAALHGVFLSRDILSRSLNHQVLQYGPLHVKSYTRVQLGLKRKGMEIKEDD